MARMSDSDSASSSRFLNRTAPPAMRPGGCTRRMIDNAVTDLPLPDSPTRPSVSPALGAAPGPQRLNALDLPPLDLGVHLENRAARRLGAGGWGLARGRLGPLRELIHPDDHTRA